MSDKAARTYTHASNRAKPLEPGERKVVFKSSLDNPFRIQWPSVPINAQNSILARVISILDGVSGYRNARGQENRKRKRPRRRETTEGVGNQKKKQRVDAESMEHGMDLDIPVDVTVIPGSLNAAAVVVASSAPPEDSQSGPPTILRHITVGINEVTKRLESQIESARRTMMVPDAVSVGSSKSRPVLKIIFVCRADIDPPLLIEHLPHLVAAFNSSQLSSQTSESIKIVPLPKGAEFALAEAMGLRRVAVMAIDVDAPELSTFSPLLDSVPTLTVPWLVRQPTVVKPIKRFVPTHIKQVRTSTPKDMKAAKERRAEGKAAAKERRRSKLRSSQNEANTKIKR